MNKMSMNVMTTLFVLLTGCGEVFVSTDGGGEVGGSGGSGGVATSSTTSTSETSGSGGSSTTTSSTTSIGGSGGSGGTGGSNLTFIDIPVSACEADYVFVPFTGYNLINSPAVSCVAVPKGASSLIIKDFTYALFKGSTSLPAMPLCDAVDHSAVWFTASLPMNGQFDISSDVTLSEKTVQVAPLVWFDFVTPEFNGTTAFVNVVMDDMVTISGNEVFCFGHKFAVNGNGDPTCLTSCLNEMNYTQHQISDSQSVPWHFLPANAWPPDGDVNKHYSFVTSVNAAPISP